MPFDLVGFSEAAPGTGTVAIAGAGGDNLYRVSGDDIIVRPEAQKLLGVFTAAESTGERLYVRQPSLYLDHQFHKIMLLTDIDPTQGYEHYFGRPLTLKGAEKVNVLIKNATDEDVLIGLLLGSSKITQGMLDAVNPTHSVLGIGDTTLTANSWSSVAITWDQDLPEGKYAVVGMKFGYWITSGNMACLARLVIPGNNDWRPGVPGVLMEADHEEFQSATYLPFTAWPLMGKEAVVEHDRMPNIECLSPAAITDENVELLLQKVG